MERRNKGQKVVSNGVASRLSFVPEHGTSGTKYGFCGTELGRSRTKLLSSSLPKANEKVNRFFQEKQNKGKANDTRPKSLTL
jgi:hypothetical protein